MIVPGLDDHLDGYGEPGGPFDTTPAERARLAALIRDYADEHPGATTALALAGEILHAGWHR